MNIKKYVIRIINNGRDISQKTIKKRLYFARKRFTNADISIRIIDPLNNENTACNERRIIEAYLKRLPMKQISRSALRPQ